VHCLVLIDDIRAAQMIRNKAQSAGHSFGVFKVWNAVAGHLRGSLLASREAALRSLERESPFRRERALQLTAWRLAHFTN